ncbi:MAG: type II secretion system protein [Phycisphaerae bacterium]
MYRRHRNMQGFTIIELLVVVAIIALLVAILMPSLSQARKHAKTVQCGANLHHVGLAVSNYLFESGGVYPASYYYPEDEFGSWSLRGQNNQHPFGYIHWSFFMYASGKVGQQAFQCPEYENGGAPRTNPGPDPENWEGGQIDQNSQANPNQLEDKQAPRMAYAANAVIMPRNKFTKTLSGGPRVNRFVQDGQITSPGNTVMVTEYLNNWQGLGVRDGGGVLSKAHRPINPFFHVGGGFDEYQAGVNNPGFIYGLPNDQKTYGLLDLKQVRAKVNILDASSGVAQINAVGRHHPSKDPLYAERFGGSANFLYADTHVDNTTVLDTIRKRHWGDAYYTITGENKVLNMQTIDQP